MYTNEPTDITTFYFVSQNTTKNNFVREEINSLNFYNVSGNPVQKRASDLN